MPWSGLCQSTHRWSAVEKWPRLTHAEPPIVRTLIHNPQRLSTAGPELSTDRPADVANLCQPVRKTPVRTPWSTEFCDRARTVCWSCPQGGEKSCRTDREP